MNKSLIDIHLDDEPRSFPPFPISLDQYERMIELGVIEEDAAVFLWRGRLVNKTGSNRPHSLVVMRLINAMREILPANYYLEQEQRLDFRFSASSPEPDVKVVRGRMDDYPNHPPTSADAPLVIEVADSSLNQGMSKGIGYAQEKIPFYWLVRVRERDVIVFSRPGARGYRKQTIETLEVPLMLDRRSLGTIAISRIFPNP